jgi:hypothetical protein
LDPLSTTLPLTLNSAITTLKGATLLDPLPTIVTNNFIFANNGAAQAVDNDDGSSHYQILNNVFYQADGFKMDYGKMIAECHLTMNPVISP